MPHSSLVVAVAIQILRPAPGYSCRENEQVYTQCGESVSGLHEKKHKAEICRACDCIRSTQLALKP